MKKTITFCTLTKGEIHAKTSLCLHNAINNKQILDIYNTRQALSMGGSDLPKARSIQLSEWYRKAQEGDVFVFIDSDQLFTTKDIITAIKYLETYPLVCGVYPRSNGNLSSVPKNLPTFYENNGGELWYGATGFMFMTFEIVKGVADFLGEEYEVTPGETAWPFFFEIVTREPMVTDKKIWLSEDFSFCKQVRNIGGTVFGFLSDTIGHTVTQDLFVNKPQYITWADNTIVYYCGITSEPWSPNSMKRGIGGSESAVIRLAEYWQNNGYEVHVFCSCDQPGVFNGVNYYHYGLFNVTDHFNICIIWRQLDLLKLIDLNAKKLYVDLHDIVSDSQLNSRIVSQLTKACFKSNYQRSLLPSLPEEKVSIITNGGYEGEKGGDDEKIDKDPNYIIYTSSYDRGLIYMLKYGWPVIKKACPDAYLNIYYGWDSFDKMQPKTEEVMAYKRSMNRLMSQDGVKECGRIPNTLLLKEKAKANIHWYTGIFQEIDCISVRESASLGAIPVVSSEQKVFLEKPYCVCVDGDPTSEEMQVRSAQQIIELLTNKELCREKRDNLKLSSQESWESVGKKWINMFNE